MTNCIQLNTVITSTIHILWGAFYSNVTCALSSTPVLSWSIYQNVPKSTQLQVSTVRSHFM